MGFISLRSTICIIIISLLLQSKIAHADIISEVKTQILDFSCETEVIGTPTEYTCTQETLVGALISAILAPPFYAFAIFHVKMVTDSVLPGNCKRANRADYHNPQIKFALCSNAALAGQRILAFAQIPIEAAKPGATVSSVLSAVWDIPKSDYYLDPNNFAWSGGTSTPYILGLDAEGSFLDLTAVFPWHVIRRHDKICVATNGITGSVPVGCVFMTEPYPNSIYGSFMQQPSQTDQPLPSGLTSQSPPRLKSCISSGSCFIDASEISMTPMPISGPLIACIRQMLAKILVSDSPSVCDFSSLNHIDVACTSTFCQFQMRMRQFVSSLLTIYVIFIGIKILLGQEMPKQGDLIMYVIKLVGVIYFSVGINVTSGGTSNGMNEYIFPILFQGANEVAGWVMNATSSGLCDFSGVTYGASGEYMALWDALDCRIGHYLGLDTVSDALNQSTSLSGAFDSLTFSIPPYAYFLGPAIETENITLIMLVLSYPILVISVAAYVVNGFVVSMIFSGILGILAPIFVPMVLFDYTKGYFESWMKLLISFVLQPMVMVMFMITMFQVYDLGFYKGCKYKHHTTPDNKLVFTIKNNTAEYFGIEEQKDYKDCMKSLGWMLNSPELALGYGALTMTRAVINSFDSDSSSGSGSGSDSSSGAPSGFSNILGAITQVTGIFFGVPNMIFSIIEHLMLSLMAACFMLYLMYNVSAQIADFAADMTEGISLGALAINPQTILKGAMAVASAGDKLNKERKLMKGSGEKRKPPPSGGSGADADNQSLAIEDKKDGGTLAIEE